MSDIIPINLAVEDDLSEAVLRTILRQSAKQYRVGTCYGKNGFGYLKKAIRGFNNAARSGTPFFVLTDLDQNSCPLALMEEWLAEPRHSNLLFRVAVREVEAWVLAHREGFAKFTGVSKNLIPQDVDTIPDPKQFLINFVKKSRKRTLIQDIVPPPGGIRKQGPNYNEPLVSFVMNSWEVEVAVTHSSSLQRAVNAINNFELTPGKS